MFHLASRSPVGVRRGSSRWEPRPLRCVPTVEPLSDQEASPSSAGCPPSLESGGRAPALREERTSPAPLSGGGPGCEVGGGYVLRRVRGRNAHAESHSRDPPGKEDPDASVPSLQDLVPSAGAPARGTPGACWIGAGELLTGTWREDSIHTADVGTVFILRSPRFGPGCGPDRQHK